MYQRPRRWRASVETLEPRRVLDSTVVFNELMYNPVGAESREWVELHNQMSVDVDLSNWKIQGGVEYEFPSGIILRGSEYLVVAANLTINVEDIDRFCGHLRLNDLPLMFDLDGDRAVGDDDLRVLVKDILGSVPGDADLNGRFDSEDFVAVFTAGQFNRDTPTASWATGDWNCDGVFDNEDLIVAAPYYS